MHAPRIALAFLLTMGSAPALSLKPTEKGVQVDAGSLGEFLLEWPVLMDAGQKPIHKLVEVHAEPARADLKYEGGGSISVTISSGGTIKLHTANFPADVRHLTSTLMIDLVYSKGGKWVIGDKSGAFPREKPATPHLFQGHSTNLEITNPQGQSLSLNVPPFSYQQLTDNREWGWGIFAWKDVLPWNPETHDFTFTFAEKSSAPAKKLVDSLGQSTTETWPDKVASLDQLSADVATETAYYDSLKTPERDAFGGLPGGKHLLGLKQTGYFHIEQKGKKSWLVDPLGNPFFHLGLCGFNPSDDFTYIKGREQIYDWLPPSTGEFATAFRPGEPENLSFYVANTIRKYHQPYDADVFTGRMIDRVRKFGFNSMGAFSSSPTESARKRNFPYVLSLPLNAWEGIPRIPGAWEVIDPYEEKVQAAVKSQLAKHLPGKAADPLLIGYFLTNEPRFDELPKVLPSLNASHACKRAFVTFLEKKYRTASKFQAAWKSTAASFNELANQGLAVTTPEAEADVKAFTGEFLKAYFQLLETEFRKNDSVHLLLGVRLQPVTIMDEQLCKIAGKHLDVMSYNYYTMELDTAQLEKIHTWTGGKPLMLSEFYWSSPADSGLTGGREVPSQKERGRHYRAYVEQAAALGYVIGIEWFTLIDQASTGRWFSKYSGESANTGLFSVTDRPWKPMAETMAKTNHEIYDVLMERRGPVTPAKATISEKK